MGLYRMAMFYILLYKRCMDMLGIEICVEHIKDNDIIPIISCITAWVPLTAYRGCGARVACRVSRGTWHVCGMWHVRGTWRVRVS